MQKLKLLQLNIEGSKHVDLVAPFLKEQNADVVCLQELNEPDVKAFEEASGLVCTFFPMNLMQSGARHGLGIFARTKPVAVWQGKYGGSKSVELPTVAPSGRREMYDTKHFILASVDVDIEGETFRIATTHFPATDHGEATDFQREDIHKLLALLEGRGELVFTGDFNAPRGREIFALIAEKYKDNIPPEITTSIDGAIHRAGQLPYMVDGIFSTPAYEVLNVVGHTGVSDHWAFTAEVKKVEI